ncbi:hypothetical protein QE152_g36050 [Popillia japonica]|uniref:Uncharacterized protein n=1 Tax=Popillia japonica TaxID=7064 RepID=A0AAW1IE76_POPJA
MTSRIHKWIIEQSYVGTPLGTRDRISKPEDLEDIMHRWRGKPLHGRYPTQIISDEIDTNATVEWIRQGQLYAETEGMMFAIQDQVIPTKYYIVPVIIGATGEIPHNLHRAIQKLELKTAIYKTMQKSVVIQTCSIVRKILSNM